MLLYNCCGFSFIEVVWFFMGHFEELFSLFVLDCSIVVPLVLIVDMNNPILYLSCIHPIELLCLHKFGEMLGNFIRRGIEGKSKEVAYFIKIIYLYSILV